MRRILTSLAVFSALAVPAQASAAITHVVTIVDENHPQGAVTASSMPYLAGLRAAYAHTTNYSAIQHPSLPNYFALTAGSTLGVGADCGTNTSACATDAENIFHQADVAGIGWNEWAESMPTTCDHQNAFPYVVHHAPPPYFNDLWATCPTEDVPLQADAVPAITEGYTFITPNNDDNGHSSALSTADAWLAKVVPQLMADPAYQDGSTLVELTWDEGNKTSNKVLTVFLNPATKRTNFKVIGAYNHYSLLRLNEELLGLPILANAASASDMRSELGL